MLVATGRARAFPGLQIETATEEGVDVVTVTEVSPSGVQVDGGPAAFSQRDKQEFANNLDRFLTKFGSAES